MHIGIAADHGGFELKEDLQRRLTAAGHDVVDFGANRLEQGDDYPDFVTQLARAVSSGVVEPGSRFAAAVWVRRSAPIKFRECERLSSTTTSRLGKGSRTTT